MNLRKAIERDVADIVRQRYAPDWKPEVHLHSDPE